MKVQKIEDCRKVYRDIIAGYTAIKKPLCYVKHLREADLGSLENRSDSILAELKENNIPTEKEVLIALDKKEIWTKANEEEYFNLIQAIKDLEHEKRKIVSREQIEQLLVVINKERERLYEIMIFREDHLKISTEYFLRKKAQEELIKISFFKDEQLKIPYFNTQEFDDIDYKGLNECFGIFNEVSETMSDYNIERVSVTPAFLNSFALCDDNSQVFWGRPVIDLTLYQINLFNYGRLNRQIIEMGGSPPEDYSDLDAVVRWFNCEHSLLLTKVEKQKRESRHGQ